MTLLLSGLIIFFGAHLLPVLQAPRQALLGSLGAGAYKGLFSLVSLAGLVLIVMGYGELQTDGSANPVLWVPPTWTKHIAFLLMIPALIFLVAAYVPSRIRTAIGHPMLVAIKIWALAHLLANGDLASLLLFGGFLAYAVIDRISVKRRARAGQPVSGPLGDSKGGLGGDIAVIVIGLAAYVFMMLVGHEWLIGIALINS